MPERQFPMFLRHNKTPFAPHIPTTFLRKDTVHNVPTYSCSITWKALALNTWINILLGRKRWKTTSKGFLRYPSSFLPLMRAGLPSFWLNKPFSACRSIFGWKYQQFCLWHGKFDQPKFSNIPIVLKFFDSYTHFALDFTNSICWIFVSSKKTVCKSR